MKSLGFLSQFLRFGDNILKLYSMCSLRFTFDKYLFTIILSHILVNILRNSRYSLCQRFIGQISCQANYDSANWPQVPHIIQSFKVPNTKIRVLSSYTPILPSYNVDLGKSIFHAQGLAITCLICFASIQRSTNEVDVVGQYVIASNDTLSKIQE